MQSSHKSYLRKHAGGSSKGEQSLEAIYIKGAKTRLELFVDVKQIWINGKQMIRTHICLVKKCKVVMVLKAMTNLPYCNIYHCVSTTVYH